MRSRLLAASAAAMALLACRTEYRGAGPVVAHEHPNGVVLRLPARLDDGREVHEVAVERTGDGFRVVLVPAEAVRWKTMATVALRPASAAPSGRLPREREVRGRTIRYTLTRDEDGGSCGGQETLRAWEACGERVLEYEQVATDECGGDLGFVWRVIEGAGCPRKGAG